MSLSTVTVTIIDYNSVGGKCDIIVKSTSVRYIYFKWICYSVKKIFFQNEFKYMLEPFLLGISEKSKEIFQNVQINK